MTATRFIGYSSLLVAIVCMGSSSTSVGAFASPIHIPSASSHGITLRTALLTSVSSSSLLSPVSPRGSSIGSGIGSSSSSGSGSTKLYAASLSGADSSLSAGGSDDGGSTGDKGTGTATVPQEIFNLVKGIVGAGVLTLPAGIASFGNAPSAAIPAVALICFIGTLSAYGFALIGRVCSLTGTTSFRDAWSASISKETSWIPAWSVTLKTLCAVLAYSMILGDTFSSLAVTAGFAVSKQATLIGVTGAVLLPLCLLKDLSSLAPFSLLGSLGMVYTATAMAVRYFGKAYVGSGRFAQDLPVAMRPAFGSIGAAGAMNPSTSILVGMLSTAYMAHFNAPKFYTELKNNTVPRYLKVVTTSFAISIALFSLVGALGFLTFGSNSAGLILNSYSNKDGLMSISRFAVALSLVFSYPLAFTGARDGVMDLIQVKDKARTPGFVNTLTAGMLSAITVAALLIPDVSFVLAFAGATLGSCLIYIYPALMFRGAIKKQKNPTKLQKFEVKVALSSALLGLGMGTMGAIKAVQSIL